jgi:type IX secretion system PorP/SprF family membrane protein
MIKFNFKILLPLLFVITNLKAQQFPVYTQHVFNDYIMNPAVAGTVDQIPIRMSYRNQWSGFIYNDVTGPISQTSAQLSYGWRTCLSPEGSCDWDKKQFLSLAYGTRLLQFSYDDTETVGWNEYFGLADDPVLPNVIETDVLLSHVVGAYYYTEYFYAGLAGQNLFARPLKIKSDLNYDNRLTAEYNILVGGYFSVTEDKQLGVEPSFLTRTTSWSKTQIDLSLRFVYQNSVSAGFVYRTAESAYGFLLGFETRDMFFGYSYDTAVQGISNYSSGTHELAIGINLNLFKRADNVRLQSRFKSERMLINPFQQKQSGSRRGVGS